MNLPNEPGVFNSFRGVRNKAWKNAPGIMRLGNEKLLEHEREAVRDLQSIHPQEFSSDSSQFDRLVRMQHFGLPTRLLDITLNPLASLYFATEIANPKLEEPTDGVVLVFRVPDDRKKYFDSDAVSCAANLANLSSTEKHEIFDGIKLPKQEFNALPAVDRLLQFIRVEKPYFRPEIDGRDLLRMNFVIPKLSNRRIIAQRGAFLLYGLADKPKTHGVARIGVTHIVVDRDAKHVIRIQLDKLDVHESSLFPEIESASGYVVRKFVGP